MQYMYYYETPLGKIGIAEENGAVTHLWFPESPPPALHADIWETPVLKRAAKQLTGYFAGGKHAFTIPLAPGGTEFMQQVWTELGKIPYGETRTYKEIASALGRKNASRAVGLANNKNSVPLLIPCHRVIGSPKKSRSTATGSITTTQLTGYSGGLDRKKKLLELENPDLVIR